MAEERPSMCLLSNVYCSRKQSLQILTWLLV